MSILIIRHGETAGNANRVVQHPETPLSERGMAQAGLLGRRLADAGITRIVASDYARAAMTAAAVAEATGLPIESDPLLRERNFGEIRGRAYADLDFDLMAPDYAPPGGEDWPSFHGRVDRAWQRVRETRAAQDGVLAVVTHGLVCFSLVARQLHLAEAGEPAMGFGNTSVTVVRAEPPWQIELLNCTAHLDADNADDAEAISGI